MQLNKTHWQTLGLAVVLAATGCGGDDGGSDDNASEDSGGSEQGTAVIATAIYGDSGSSNIELVELDDADKTAGGGVFPEGQTDIGVVARGSHFYRLGRLQIDNVAKRSTVNPMNSVWQYSALAEGDQGSANPSDMIFVNDQKAYLLRYASNTAWIVNPSAQREAQFKIGELDLSAYDDGDGQVEMQTGVIVGDKLFIALQRLEGFEATATSYLAVFDTRTNTEIDTQTDNQNGLKGIPLRVRNPLNMEYLAGSGLYVQGVGDYAGPNDTKDFTGGIERVAVDDYSTELVVDDGPTDPEAGEHPYGQINNLALANASTGYFIGYASYGNTTLYRFNPSTGQVAGAVSGLQGVDLRDIAVSPQGKLWVAVANSRNPRVLIRDPQSQTQVDEVLTQMPPIDIAFAPGD